VTTLRRCTAEFLGTAILVAIGPGAAMVAARTGAFGHQGVALAFGLPLPWTYELLRTESAPAVPAAAVTGTEGPVV
jgi:aquaporin Z